MGSFYKMITLCVFGIPTLALKMKNCKWIILTLCFLLGVNSAQAQSTLDFVEQLKSSGLFDNATSLPDDFLKNLQGEEAVPFEFDPKAALRSNRMDMDEDDIQKSIDEQRQINQPTIDLKNVVFGREIFSTQNLTFAPDLNAPTPKNYRLSAGDELFIDVWGDAELHLECVISADGVILIPSAGPVMVSGLTIDAAEKQIKRELGKIVSGLVTAEDDIPGTFVSVTLAKMRTVKVNIVGEAVAPGTYALPAFSTLFNALYAAGGVNDIGSLRSIRLFRNSQEIAILDVYDYLFNGRSNTNVRLEENDMIIVEPYTQLVTVTGKVKRERIFEVKEGETLNQVLRMAGGFTGDAYREDIRIRRKTGRQYQMATVHKEQFNDFLMHDGDILMIDSVIPFYENRVIVAGAVWRPGEYELSPEMNTVKQLIDMANGLKGNEFLGRAQIDRLNPDFTKSVFAIDIKGILNGTTPDVVLQKEDVLIIPSLFDLREAYTIKVSGAVNAPKTLPYSYNMTVEDAIIKAGGLKESAATVNVEVARRIKNPGSTESTNVIAERFSFTLSDELVYEHGEELFTLEPFDEVYVRYSPGYSKQQVIKINGEVAFEGDYVLAEKNSRLSDLVKQAGGVTPDAYVKGASLKRRVTEDELRRIETLMDLNGGRISDSLSLADIDLKTYAVGVDLEKALSQKGSYYDLVLQDGDELYVPQFQSTVKVSGKVTYPNSLTYTNRLSVKDCILQAGGYDESARKYPIVVYMNGTVATTKKRMFGKKYPKVEPGCEIIVPTKSARSLRSLQEIMTLTSSTTSIAAMVTSIINSMK